MPRIVLAAILLLQALLLAGEAWSIGATFDEPAHLAASQAFWEGEDILLPSSTPVLQHWLTGWAPGAFGIGLRRELPGWKNRSMYDCGYETFALAGAGTARRTLATARMLLAAFGLLLTLTLYRVGAEAYGPWTGVALAAFGALEPNLLAHGALVKTDVAATAAAVWVCYAAWRFWRKPGLGPFLELAGGLTLGVLAKYTLFVLVPLALAVVVLRLWRLHRIRAVAAPLLLAFVLYAAVCTAYRWDVDWPGSAAFQRLYQDHHWKPAEIAWFERLTPVPVPVSLVRGVHFIWRHGSQEGQPAYFFGRLAEPPQPWYFPAALALKLPLSLLALLGAALAFAISHLRQPGSRAALAFFWLPGLTILEMAMGSRLLVGVRYVLPCVGLFLAGAAPLVHWAGRRAWGRAAVAALLLWLGGASLGVYPNGLSYFHEAAGGPSNGWRYLADSNLDWGQNLPQLRTEADRLGIGHLHVSYFGQDYLPHYFEKSRIESIPNPFCAECVTGPVFRPEPGWYAISVNLLLGYHWPPPYDGFFQAFRERRPDARAGYSIYLYRVE